MIAMTFELSGRGWAAFTFSGGEGAVRADTSYLSDALGDMARAVRGLTRGLPETRFDVQEEPGQCGVVFRLEGQVVRAEVLRSKRNFDQQKKDEVMMAAACELRELVRTAVRCLTAVAAAHGEEEYRRLWVNHEFPTRELEDLRAWIKAAKVDGR